MMRAISGSTIAINPHADFMEDGGNQRLFEACGAGTLQITNECPAVHRWFEVGKHLLTYSDARELGSLIAHYLEDESARERIAAAGQAHVYAHHTFDLRMTRLIDLIETERTPSNSDRARRTDGVRPW
jgi:spore maturation protein CgeB